MLEEKNTQSESPPNYLYLAQTTKTIKINKKQKYVKQKYKKVFLQNPRNK